MSDSHRFIVVANRLPVDDVSEVDGRPEWSVSPGGLVSALAPIVRASQGAWIGWSGRPGTAPEPFTFDGISLQPVGLSVDEVDDYYEGHANGTIWPLFHDAIEPPIYRTQWRRAYTMINRRFAEATARVAAPNATVWVHDYQLMLVPAMLRALRPDVRIGFFLHIPFPPVELFMQLPGRTTIIRGLLGADLIGFQRPLAAQNFLHLTRRLVGLETGPSDVDYDGRTVIAQAFPISIDTADIENRARNPRVQARARQLRREIGGERRILLGVDRLDYTKGIEQRLTAFHELLAEGDLSNETDVLVQVAIPSRQRVAQYRQLRERVQAEVGRINGEYGNIGNAPVQYLFRSVDRDELVALYLAADLMLVTPLRDGMNLVAKEFVAARSDERGTLVLSEFTGAAAELDSAFLVNPHDIDGMKNTILRALHAQPADVTARMRQLREQVLTHDVQRWAREFLEALGHAG